MNLSEAACHPYSYYTDIAFFCANYLTRVLSPNASMTIFLFDQHDGWQSYLRESIESVLHRARLDDSVAIGALVLMEKLCDSTWPRHPYPDELYLKYFMAAYTLAHRSLSRTRRPKREGFWADIFADIIAPQKLPSITRTFVRALDYDTRISEGRFVDMRSRMYAFIRTHKRMRSGEQYERSRGAILLASPPEVFDLPPYCDESVRRRCKSGLTSIDSNGNEECQTNISDRLPCEAQFRPSLTKIV